MFSGWNDRLRFAVAPFCLGLFAAGVTVRLLFLHLGLVSEQPATPKYDFKVLTDAGRRGSIFSTDGMVLAQTTTVWEYHLDSQEAGKDPFHPNKPILPAKRMEKIKAVSELLKLPLVKVMDAYASGGRYVRLASSSDSSVHAVLANPTNHFKGLIIDEKQVRMYPQGNRLSQVVGFVSKDPTNSVGGAGLELKYEESLKGRKGEIRGIKDAVGHEDRSRRTLFVGSKNGYDIWLTIDNNVQFETERALRAGIVEHRAERAWAIVLSVKTGAVLAMVNLPDYDPEKFNKSSDDSRVNRAISQVYEPGSVMKTITACAVLNEGRVGPDSMINTARNDPNYYRLPGDVGHKWDEYMSVRDALVHSSNIVFGKLGSDLGPTRLYNYMTSMGLGRKTGIELPGEEIGIIPTPQNWDKVKWSRAPIGQGVAVTAIQLAAAYACIGNGGELLRPYIVQRVVRADGTEVSGHHQKEVMGHPISAKVARQVLAMMTGVAKKGGTAKRAAVPGYSVAGKTGTAQMKEGRGYSSTNFHASFIGIVPATRPEIVILVTYQKPFYCRSKATSEAEGVPIFNHQGGVCAAPTFRRIAEPVLRYLEVEPDIPEEVPEEDDDTTAGY